jgi:hypothetical protein
MPEKQIPRELLELRERLNARVKGPFVQPNPNMPQVEVPPMWRKPHMEKGTSTSEARVIDRLLNNFFPKLRGNISSITSGYGPGYINRLSNQAVNHPMSYGRFDARDMLGMIQPTNLLGLANIPKRTIEVNAPSDQFEDTMFHEMLHLTQPESSDVSQFQAQEQEADELENLYRTYKMNIVDPRIKRRNINVSGR